MKDVTISSQQETTIDYPGKMGLILFTPGCNFRCGFCHNPELIEESSNRIDMDVLLKNIFNRKNAGWYSGICISGGEPTLHSGLIDFIKKLKEIGLSVKLDTNGSNPDALRKLLDLVDYVAMDIKSTCEKYSEVSGVPVDMEAINESIKLLREFPMYEFRTTVLPNMNESDFEEIGKWITDNGKNKVKLYTLQQFSPKNTLDSSFMKLIPKTSEEIERLSEVMKKYALHVQIKSI